MKGDGASPVRIIAHPDRTPFLIAFSHELIDEKVAERFGTDAYALLIAVADWQDRIHGEPPDFYVKQLSAMIGFSVTNERRFRAAREQALKSGKLRYKPNPAGHHGPAIYGVFPSWMCDHPTTCQIAPSDTQETPYQNAPSHEQADHNPVQNGTLTPCKTACDPLQNGTHPPAKRHPDPLQNGTPSSPNTLYPNSPPPPPIQNEGGRGDLISDGIESNEDNCPTPRGWERVRDVLAELGVNQVQSTIGKAKSAGYLPEQIFDLVNAYRSSNGKIGLGALVTRIREGSPNSDPWTGWIESIQKALDRQKNPPATPRDTSPQKLSKAKQLIEDLKVEFSHVLTQMSDDEFSALCTEARLKPRETRDAKEARNKKEPWTTETLPALAEALQARELEVMQ